MNKKYKLQKMNIKMNFEYNVISFSIPGQLRDTIVLTDGREDAATIRRKILSYLIYLNNRVSLAGFQYLWNCRKGNH